MGSASKRKGSRMELAMVRLFQDAGFAAEKQPLSGALGGKYAGDLSVPVLGADWRVECKCRATDFTRIYGWLAGNQALIVKADRKEPLVVLPLKRAVEILKAAEEYRTRRVVA